MVVLIVVLSIMFLRISVMAAAYSLTQDIEFLYSQTKLMVSMCAAGLNLLCIVILNQVSNSILLIIPIVLLIKSFQISAL